MILYNGSVQYYCTTELLLRWKRKKDGIKHTWYVWISCNKNNKGMLQLELLICDILAAVNITLFTAVKMLTILEVDKYG